MKILVTLLVLINLTKNMVCNSSEVSGTDLKLAAQVL